VACCPGAPHALNAAWWAAFAAAGGAPPGPVVPSEPLSIACGVWRNRDAMFFQALLQRGAAGARAGARRRCCRTRRGGIGLVEPPALVAITTATSHDGERREAGITRRARLELIFRGFICGCPFRDVLISRRCRCWLSSCCSPCCGVAPGACPGITYRGGVIEPAGTLQALDHDRVAGAHDALETASLLVSLVAEESVTLTCCPSCRSGRSCCH